jgi:hypothetical protein
VGVPNTVAVVDGAKALIGAYDLDGVVALSQLVACAVARSATAGEGCVLNDCYLVDPASSHMLVSKIKPCMSQYLL